MFMTYAFSKQASKQACMHACVAASSDFQPKNLIIVNSDFSGMLYPENLRVWHACFVVRYIWESV